MHGPLGRNIYSGPEDFFVYLHHVVEALSRMVTVDDMIKWGTEGLHCSLLELAHESNKTT